MLTNTFVIKMKIFFGATALVVALLSAAAAFCVVAERSRARAAETEIRLDAAERARRAFAEVSDALTLVAASADAIPVENFEEVLLRSETDAGRKLLELSDAGFYFRRDAAGESCGIYGGNASGEGEFMPVAKRSEIAGRVTDFADSRVPAAISWRELCAPFFDSAKELDEYGEAVERGETPKRVPPEVRFAAKEKPPHDVRFQPRLGCWTESMRVSREPGEKKFSSGFRFEVFDGKIFLVREIRSPETKKFVQGFLLNESKLLAVLRTKARGTLPDASLELAPVDSAEADISPCGLPLKFSAGTLPEEIAARAELNAFRATLACAWGVCAALCAGALAALRLFLLSAERRRIFLAAVVHDLRSPVAGMAALSDEMLARRSGAADDFSEETRDLRRLVGRVRDLSALLDNTLLFSRIAGTRDGGDALKFRDVTAGEILPPIFERITERLDRAGTDFDTNVSDAAAAAELRVSPAALERILFNLADNAAKYAATADVPVLTLTAEIVARSRGRKRLEIRVADNGGGLSAKARKNLFREFSRTAQDATDTGVHGLGIGLALSKKLARILGGDLALEKSDASGTTFLLTLFPK